MFTNKYPYSDFHELNADWLLSEIKPLQDKIGAVEQQLDTKVDKVPGMGLSENDFTDADKTKLDGIETGAQVNVQADWDQLDMAADDYIKNKPAIPLKNIWYATCTTAGSTAAKIATTDTGDFVLAAGNMVRVIFTNPNSASTETTLNVDGTGDIPVGRIQQSNPGTSARYMIGTGESVDLVYNGTIFVMSNKTIASSTYYGLVRLNSSTTSSSENYAATPKAVKTVNDALAGKVDAVAGMGLSENDFTDADKSKLDGIEAGAQVNVAEITVTDITVTLTSGVDYFYVPANIGETVINMYIVEGWQGSSSVIEGFMRDGSQYIAILKTAPTANRSTTVRLIKYLGG